jgi:hypothetical protein
MIGADVRPESTDTVEKLNLRADHDLEGGSRPRGKIRQGFGGTSRIAACGPRIRHAATIALCGDFGARNRDFRHRSFSDFFNIG